MLRITREFVTEVLSGENPPAARCTSGETVVFETRDCYDDVITCAERPLGDREAEFENPATGPLYIEGAMPGDALKVEILEIKPRGWGVMRSAPKAGAFVGRFPTREARVFDISDGFIRFGEKLALPVDTMIGVIGVAPEGEGIPTTTPGAHGGNMDCQRIVAGSTLYLPVHHEGALLSMGDLHARMGDGEVFICGLETAGEVTVRVTALKEVSLPTPFLYCRGKVMSIQSAETLEEAGLLAVRALFDFVIAATGQSDLDAGMQMSLLCDMAICQIVDPLLTVRAEFPLDVLERFGWKLP